MKTLPVLNIPMLLDLIHWAEAGEADTFEGWGQWAQNNWGSITNPTDTTVIIPADRDGGVCRTSYCMAGQSAVQSGYRLIYEGLDDEVRDASNVTVSRYSTIYANYCVPQEPTGRFSPKGLAIYGDVPGVDPQPIEVVGRKILGMTEDEAEAFFAGENEITMLKSMANLFAEVRGFSVLFEDTNVIDQQLLAEEYGIEFDYSDYVAPSQPVAV